MTISLFSKDTYLFESQAIITILDQDDKGCYIVLDKTIFYPQGGGQPSDHGVLISGDTQTHITHVKQIEGEIRHYISTKPDLPIGTSVICFMDQERRILNAKYHTAAHLLSNVVEQACPALKAVKGHSFPKEAYVEFQGSEIPDSCILTELLNKAIHTCLQTKTFGIDSATFEKEFYKLPYFIPENKSFRAIQIGHYLPIPCGGTHVSNCSEIGYI